MGRVGVEMGGEEGCMRLYVTTLTGVGMGEVMLTVAGNKGMVEMAVVTAEELRGLELSKKAAGMVGVARVVGEVGAELGTGGEVGAEKGLTPLTRVRLAWKDGGGGGGMEELERERTVGGIRGVIGGEVGMESEEVEMEGVDVGEVLTERREDEDNAEEEEEEREEEEEDKLRTGTEGMADAAYLMA